ncbi:MAG: methyltransferase type 11 [Proteobacteria bacterium]|uniref:methyltransferase type 11 n=1 Tax=Brevundimonas sp. TaxID=1871086 RepID=UPI001AC44D39|nr:methyltransferase type 11 [Brevundimonas sp.]MBN9466918.1 methyltransferase type 11 [Brevundimonas sp.]MCA0368875.1 methyltransferase type 11 [Pseudomonadota bacterium]
MRPFLLPLLLIAGLGACDGENSFRITASTSDDGAGKGVLRVIDALQCPDAVGVLTRKGLAANGSANCVYGGPKGAEVILHLVKLDGRTPDAVLKDFEAQMAASLPQADARLKADQPPAPPPAATNGGDEATVQAPGVDIRTKGDDASVRLPGLSIDTRGDNANVRIGGINIQAKDGQGVRTETSTVSVDSSGPSTRVRARAPGAATRMTYVVADDQPSPAGWRRVGFEARGPEGGPLVVATIRSKDRNGDRVFDSAKDLVSLNVGD